MTYARDKICFDADSHRMPRPDFLSAHADPKYREALYIDGGPNGGERFAKWFGKIVSEVEERIGDPEKTKQLEQNVISSAKGWAAHGAVYPEERSRTLDLLGFRAQLVFSTFAGHFLRGDDPDLMYGGTRAHSRAMADFCAHDERLLGVALIPLHDPARAIQELDEALSLGCRAVHVPSDAPRRQHARLFSGTR